VNLLVPNLGSTSLKYQLIEMPSGRSLAKGRLERVRDYGEAIGQIRTDGARIDGVAFKAVLAGPRYRGTFRIDGDLIQALEQYLPASPAHLTESRSLGCSLKALPFVRESFVMFSISSRSSASSWPR